MVRERNPELGSRGSGSTRYLRCEVYGFVGKLKLLEAVLASITRGKWMP